MLGKFPRLLFRLMGGGGRSSLSSSSSSSVVEVLSLFSGMVKEDGLCFLLLELLLCFSLSTLLENTDGSSNVDMVDMTSQFTSNVMPSRESGGGWEARYCVNGAMVEY